MEDINDEKYLKLQSKIENSTTAEDVLYFMAEAIHKGWESLFRQGRQTLVNQFHYKKSPDGTLIKPEHGRK